MKVVYITYPWFLDFSIEYIKELSGKVDLHVVVLTSEGKLSSTIFNLLKIPDKNVKDLYSFHEIRNELKDDNLFEFYFQDCKSISFVFFPKKRVGFSGFVKNRKLGKMINTINPNLIHFDDISIELFALPLFVKSKKWIINVHDPKPHSGEEDWRRKLIRRIIYPRAKIFLTFSNYSKEIFRSIYGLEKKVHSLSLVPYTFYSRYEVNQMPSQIEGDYLLFIGRVSRYKGLDDLVRSFKEVSKKKSDVKLVIAGKWKKNFSLPDDLANCQSVIIIDRFLENEEVATLIRNSMAVVCPYKDATQSGVVMTSFGLNKNVVVSNVGGLSETIFPESGIVYDRSKPLGLTEALLTLFEKQANGVTFVNSKEISAEYNTDKLIKIYQTI